MPLTRVTLAECQFMLCFYRVISLNIQYVMYREFKYIYIYIYIIYASMYQVIICHISHWLIEKIQMWALLRKDIFIDVER